MHETHGSAVLPLIRIGEHRGVAACSFKTKNRSAKAGRRYVGTKGEVVFQDGEYEVDVRVERYGSRATVSFESLHIRIPLKLCQNSAKLS